MLRQMVALCFPESQLKIVGSFMFLRFICPAIATPLYFDLHDGQFTNSLLKLQMSV
jgi:hypothetical protein